MIWWPPSSAWTNMHPVVTRGPLQDSSASCLPQPLPKRKPRLVCSCVPACHGGTRGSGRALVDGTPMRKPSVLHVSACPHCPGLEYQSNRERHGGAATMSVAARARITALRTVSTFCLPQPSLGRVGVDKMWKPSWSTCIASFRKSLASHITPVQI